VLASYKIKNEDKIAHNVTRIETPVIDQKIEIVFENDELVAVNKPSSIPVHACGNFRHNSL
jgi:tRNA pseudouridine synthase 8/2,5-diamino-6-(5-phospho-D-ribitylamino)-pyrimidin-4(3H)-one deaminase